MLSSLFRITYHTLSLSTLPAGIQAAGSLTHSTKRGDFSGNKKTASWCCNKKIREVCVICATCGPAAPCGAASQWSNDFSHSYLPPGIFPFPLPSNGVEARSAFRRRSPIGTSRVLDKEAGFRLHGSPALRDGISTGINSGNTSIRLSPIFQGFLSSS